jgi:hypothetical protein
MRVYMGPYRTTWITVSFHYDYMNKKYQYNWEKSNTRFEKVLEKFEGWCQTVLNATANKLITNRKRKIKVRIDEYDTWSMDNTLAHIVLPMLKQLRNTKHGSPYIDQEDVPLELRLSEREDAVFNHGSYDKSLNASEEELEAASEKFHNQWKWVIDQMIWSFEQELVEDDEHKNYYDPYEPNERVESDDLFDSDYKRKMGKFNHEKYIVYHERKQKGFTLFGKYFQSLWD